MKKPPSKELVAVLDSMIDLVRRVEKLEKKLDFSGHRYVEPGTSLWEAGRRMSRSAERKQAAKENTDG